MRGHGWNHSLWGNRWPTAADLDRVTGGRPALLSRKDGHSIWLNSRALALAGIERDTPDPAGGTIGRDEHGEPSGVLFENANEMAYRIVPDYSLGGATACAAADHRRMQPAWPDQPAYSRRTGYPGTAT